MITGARQTMTDGISVPPERRGELLSAFPLSMRLINILGAMGLRLAGDLEGRRLGEFRRRRNCGAAALRELQQLISLLQAGAVVRGRRGVERTVSKARFSVPHQAARLRLSELPLSPQLEDALLDEGIRCLGDLQGLPESLLQSAGQHSHKIILELKHVLRRAEAGEFEIAPQDQGHLRTFDIFLQLDELVSALPQTERDVLLLRLGSRDGAPRLLGEIGPRFGLSRSMTWQVVQKALAALRRHECPKLKCQLEQLTQDCLRSVCPLTVELVRSWAGEQPWPCRHRPEFYVRLLAELCHDLPVWLKRLPRPATNGLHLHSVAARIEQSLHGCTEYEPLRRAYQRVLAANPADPITVRQFLLALPQIRQLQIAFPQPRHPQVRFKGQTRTRAVIAGGNGTSGAAAEL